MAVKLTVFDQSGKELRKLEVAAEVFGVTPNQQVMYDAAVMQRASQRQGTHDVKGRSEVRGGGRKPWRQKGTGRARQGSIRSPQWRGGGIVFGPTPRKYGYRLNRKVRRLAIKSVLSAKVLDKKAIVLDSIVMDEIKTKDFIKLMEALNLGTKTLFVVTNDENWENAYMSMRNLPNTLLLTVEGLNVLDIMGADHIVMTEAAAKLAGEVLA